MRYEGDKSNLNLVQSAHARYPKSFLPCSNQRQRWILDDATGDEGTPEKNLPVPAFKLLAEQ